MHRAGAQALTWINRAGTCTIPSSGTFSMTSPLLPWLTTLIAAAIFTVMLSLGLMVGREQVAAVRERPLALAAALFAVLVPVPAAAVLLVKLAGLKGVAAAGILLMAISPGAPIALRRAIEAGGSRAFAPALHVVVVALAIVSVPASVAILDAIYQKNFAVSPMDVGRQVFFAQLLPLAIGAAIRAWRPALAARLEPHLARLSGALLSRSPSRCSSSYGRSWRRSAGRRSWPASASRCAHSPWAPPSWCAMRRCGPRWRWRPRCAIRVWRCSSRRSTRCPRAWSPRYSATRSAWRWWSPCSSSGRAGVRDNVRAMIRTASSAAA
jgi:hypothetical protein